MEVAHPCVGVTAFPRNSRATLTGSQKPTRRCTGLVGAHPQAGGSNASLSRVQSAECRVQSAQEAAHVLWWFLAE